MGIICLILAFFIRNWTENRINFYLGQINSGSERIAQVKNRNNEVTRNHSGQLLWQSIDSGEVLYIGNSVQTEKNSSTEIIFDDGEQVVIGPESLVRFIRSENKILLELVSGKVEIKGADIEVEKNMRIPATQPKRLMIATPKGRLALNNSNIKIAAKDGSSAADFKIQVVSGAPELINGPKIEVLKISTESEKIVVLPAAKPAAKPLEALIEPLPTQEAQVELSKPIEEKVLTVENTEPIQPKTETEPLRQPAQAPLKSPKVKSIKVEAFE